MVAIYRYDVTVTSCQNSKKTMTVMASTKAEALFQAGGQFSRTAYSDTASRQDQVLYAAIMRERISHLDVTQVD